MLLINLFNAGTPVSELRMSASTITIGRDVRSSVVLEDRTRHISRRHATIERDGDGYSIAVHSRVNPVRVDGRVMHAGQSMRLMDGARICMSPFELAITMLADKPGPAAATRRESVLPRATPPTPPTPPASPAPAPAPAPRFLAWARAALAQDPSPASEEGDDRDRLAPHRGGMRPAAIARAPDSSAGPCVHDAAEAYLRGLGVPYVHSRPGEETVFLEQAGLLTQSIVEALMALLRARTLVRRELNVDPGGTPGAGDLPNALKSTANPAEALAWLFDPSLREQEGLLPVQAVEQVASDLEAHQAGLAAGLRAAVLGMMTRFDPTIFEKDASASPGSSAIDQAAKSWEAYVAAYSKLSADTVDGIGGLINADFRRAYEDCTKVPDR